MYNRHNLLPAWLPAWRPALRSAFYPVQTGEGDGPQFSRTPVGRTIKHLGTMMSEMMGAIE